MKNVLWPPNQAQSYKTFYMLNSAEHEFILLINVKMPTIVGILTFISMINKTSESLKARKVNIFQYYSFMSGLIFVISWVKHEKSL